MHLGESRGTLIFDARQKPNSTPTTIAPVGIHLRFATTDGTSGALPAWCSQSTVKGAETRRTLCVFYKPRAILTA